MSIFVIGLTGPTGAGKSVAAEIFAQQNIPVINADLVAREVVLPGSRALKMLCERFSEKILNPDGTLNRKELAARAFKDKESTQAINRITHPFIIERINQRIRELEAKGERAVLIDAPLLFEAEADKFCNTTIAILADINIRLERIIKRDNITKQQAIERIKSQKPDDFYRSRADHIIYNNGDLKAFRQSVANIISKLVYNNED
ncbi:MAG TPA: dephospho-CoA kinase [Clostridiales bacterium]|nr:dephospho-CoA kinase [Clostridiales bacterium]